MAVIGLDEAEEDGFLWIYWRGPDFVSVGWWPWSAVAIATNVGYCGA